MNEFNIVGKALGEIDVKQSDSGTKYAQLLVSIKRPFKNKDGGNDSDIVQITMFNNCAEEAKEIVSDGTPLLIKGHLGANNYAKEGKTIYSTSIIADRISLINNLY